MQTNTRNILTIEPGSKTFNLSQIDSAHLPADSKKEYPFLSGESLCQYLLQENLHSMILAGGPLSFFPGNKFTVGYISPLTELPHYSFVGGHSSAQLFYLGLDAIVLKPSETDISSYIVIEGRVPNIRVRFESSKNLPHGQRTALYRLIERELGSDFNAGSVFTLGHGAYHGYKSANIAVEGIYHAGRGGAGHLFARMSHALVLKGAPITAQKALGKKRYNQFQKLMKKKISPRIDKYCARLARPDTGTIVKLAATGGKIQNNTLPARNAQQLGYKAADLGAGKTLMAARDGHTACQWCEVRCRHYTLLKADYAPDGTDAFLDDFEPAYSICAMLDLQPNGDKFEDLLELRQFTDENLFVPIEQMGCDVMDIGIAISALFEGIEKGIIPAEDVPDSLNGGKTLLGNREAAKLVIDLLNKGAENYKAVKACGDGPEGLAALYPAMKDLVFTCGPKTLGNAGHCNKLWTFLMPFSRFFSHYSGQIYKINEELPSDVSDEEAFKIFKRVIKQMIDREIVCVIGNSLSLCAFVFNIFSVNGKGELIDYPLLLETLGIFGIDIDSATLNNQAETFLTQSIEFRKKCGWKPQTAEEYPYRIFESVSKAINIPPERCKALFDLLIKAWGESAESLIV
ncbi:aldehyde ferredoxin oxidoreductase N-terminal domain-containing protein [Verrucomicrobiota bacterium]